MKMVQVSGLITGYKQYIQVYKIQNVYTKKIAFPITMKYNV